MAVFVNRKPIIVKHPRDNLASQTSETVQKLYQIYAMHQILQCFNPISQHHYPCEVICNLHRKKNQIPEY